MPPVYAATAPEWLQTVKTLPVGTELAFWQPTPAEPNEIAVGERWYFKERGRPLIHGYGNFRRWETASLGDLFQRFGPATGYRTADELTRGIQALREGATLATFVGNVILSGFNEFDPPQNLAALGLEDLSIRFRYIRRPDPLAAALVKAPIGAEIAAEAPSSTGSAGRSGPTTGLIPSDWTRTVSQSANAPAFVYAFRFGKSNIWKVGWADDVQRRLDEANYHIPHEILDAQWRHAYQEPMPSRTRAYEMEQHMFEALAKFRTHKERLNCSEKDLVTAWVAMVRQNKR